MNEFVHRIDSVTAERQAPVVRSVPAVPPVREGQSASANLSHGEADAGSGDQARREHMASVFDYARVQARVASILAEIDASRAVATASSSHAEVQLDELRVEPVVVIPMLPASVETIERAIQVARAMAEKAAMTRSAQANVGLNAVNQMLAASV